MTTVDPTVSRPLEHVILRRSLVPIPLFYNTFFHLLHPLTINRASILDLVTREQP